MLPPFCPNAPGMTDYRVEKDFLGELKVPKDAYWGAQTQRAIENFPISGIRFGRRFLYALGLINMAAAQTNMELGLLDSKIRTANDKNLPPTHEELKESRATKAQEFDPIEKSGRTHLMDATPIRLGLEFSGYQSQIDHGIRRVSSCRAALAELAIGGTAVGSGINAHPEFPGRVVEKISAATDTKFRVAENDFEAQASQDALVEASGAIGAV